MIQIMSQTELSLITLRKKIKKYINLKKLSYPNYIFSDLNNLTLIKKTLFNKIINMIS
jgi:hypothetical protein